MPLLGVCLGHQAIGYAFGGKVIRAPQLMHGKTSRIHHDNKTIFRKLPQDFRGYALPLSYRRDEDRCRAIWRFRPRPTA